MNPEPTSFQPTPFQVAPFQVETPAFTGSLGELAYALRTGRVLPGDLELFSLVTCYLTHYRLVAERDLDLATETLPALARLVELKLRLLLPTPPKAAETEELETALETVLALEAFEGAIGFLRERREERRHLLSAHAERPPLPRRARPLAGKLGRLAELATRRRVTHYFELAVERLTLGAAMTRLRERLRHLGRGTLQTLMDARDWPTVTVAFGAMLELVKEGEVTAVQRSAYEIEIELEPAHPDPA